MIDWCGQQSAAGPSNHLGIRTQKPIYLSSRHAVLVFSTRRERISLGCVSAFSARHVSKKTVSWNVVDPENRCRASASQPRVGENRSYACLNSPRTPTRGPSSIAVSRKIPDRSFHLRMKKPRVTGLHRLRPQDRRAELIEPMLAAKAQKKCPHFPLFGGISSPW